MITSPNQTREPNCRPASPLDAGRQFDRAIHARPSVYGGSRSALRLGDDTFSIFALLLVSVISAQWQAVYASQGTPSARRLNGVSRLANYARCTGVSGKCRTLWARVAGSAPNQLDNRHRHEHTSN